MEFSIEITEAAKFDILDGVYYYQNISKSLADRFYFEVVTSLNAIQKNPTYFSYYNKPFRRLLLKHFPYLVIYKIYDDIVIITGVLFAKQNPVKLKQRSKD
jgi:hypothetical protein